MAETGDESVGAETPAGMPAERLSVLVPTEPPSGAHYPSTVAGSDRGMLKHWEPQPNSLAAPALSGSMTAWKHRERHTHRLRWPKGRCSAPTRRPVCCRSRRAGFTRRCAQAGCHAFVSGAIFASRAGCLRTGLPRRRRSKQALAGRAAVAAHRSTTTQFGWHAYAGSKIPRRCQLFTRGVSCSTYW
jgi:hypothetical protein